jgi:hypothetical protein
MKDFIKILLREQLNQNNQRQHFLKWKRNNITIRGIKELGKDNNVFGSFGKGLYTTPLSNKQMAKQYGQPYFVLNAIPKNPYITNSLNQAEILIQKLINDFSKKNNISYNPKFFNDNTSIENEMIKLGYDGLIIKGREMVNYKPNDIKYFKTENELFQYYLNNIKQDNLNEVRYIDTSYPNINNQEPIKGNQTIRVYHGFNKFDDVETVLKNGLSGKEKLTENGLD